MSSVDPITWACDRLRQFIDASARQHNPPPPGVISGGDYGPKASEDEVLRQWAVVERVLQHYLPDWQSRLGPGDGYTYTGYRWGERREGAALCLAALQAEAEVREHLETRGPSLSADALHPWIWDSARSLWNSQHHREAVEAAAKGLNAYTQQKTGMTLAEGDLFVQAFSDDGPKPDRPRLRPVGGSDDSLSVRSLRRGIRDYASGCYAAIRNPKAHDDPTIDTPEHEALEQLAALSVLARWVEGATLVMA